MDNDDKEKEQKELSYPEKNQEQRSCVPWDNDCSDCGECVDPCPPEPCEPTCSFDPGLIQEIINCICDLKEQIAFCEGILLSLHRAVFSPTFGLSEIKAEVSFIETTVNNIINEVTSPTFGLSEIKAEVSFIESTVIDIDNQINSATFGLQEIKSEVSAILSMMEESTDAGFFRTTGPFLKLLENSMELKAYNGTSSPQSVTFVVRNVDACTVINTAFFPTISSCCGERAVVGLPEGPFVNLAVNAQVSSSSGIYLYAGLLDFTPTFPVKGTEVLAEQWLPLASFCL